MINSKELKEKIVKELAVKNLAEAESLLGVRREHFTEEDFQEVKRAITENVKRHADEWRIREVMTFNGYYGGDFYGEKKEFMLLHRLASLDKYDELGILIIDPRRMIFKETYPKEQWAEIDKLYLNLSNQLANSLSNNPKSSNLPNLTFPLVAGMVASISLLAIVAMIFYLKKPKKSR